MKKLYIKYTKDNYKEALEKARELGYWNWGEFTEYIWGIEDWGILRMSANWDILSTPFTEQELIDNWYEEYKLEEQKEPHYVYVSDVSVEKALERKNKRILIDDIWEQFNIRYICVFDSYEEAYLKWEKI
jgi:hypothetical protein